MKFNLALLSLFSIAVLNPRCAVLDKMEKDRADMLEAMTPQEREHFLDREEYDRRQTLLSQQREQEKWERDFDNEADKMDRKVQDAKDRAAGLDVRRSDSEIKCDETIDPNGQKHLICNKNSVIKK